MSDPPPKSAERSPPAHAEQPPIPIQPPESWESPKEQAPMLDVHPAHHAASPWREFFIHIATIVIGLLIAVGLEQTVEYFHHEHQLHDVRQGILADARLYLHDVDELRLVNRQRIEDLNTRIDQLSATLSRHQHLVSPLFRPAP